MSIISKLKFSTSNKKKQEEISAISDIPFIHSIDLPEIDSDDWILVAAYKAKDVYNHTKEEGVIVEDSILIIGDEIFSDIKFKYDYFVKNINLFLNKKVSFIVTTSVFINNKIYCFQGKIEGLIKNKTIDGYYFDPYIFINTPLGFLSLTDLDNLGKKIDFSPRTISVKLLTDYFSNTNLEKKENIFIFNYKDLPDWNGNYQS